MPQNPSARPSPGARPSKTDRREAARLEAVRLREAQQREAKRQRLVIIGLLGVGLLVVGGAIAWIFSNMAEPIPAPDFSDVENPLGTVTAPASADDTGAIPVGQSGVAGEATDGPVVVEVYSDYRCPACGAFEQTNGPLLDELREAGEIVVEYRPVAIVGGGDASTRLATAAAYVADQAPEAFVAFNAGLFANQEAGGQVGLTNEQVADLAQAAGVPDDVAAPIRDGSFLTGERSFVPWVVAATTEAGRTYENFGTPLIVVGGERLAGDWRVEGALATAIEEARG